MGFLRYILLFILTTTLFSCGDEERVQIVDNAHDYLTTGLRWKAQDFPLTIRVPQSYQEQSAVVLSLESAVESWNSALGFLAIELEYLGNNVQYPTPSDYLLDEIFSLAFPSKWIAKERDTLALTSFSYQGKYLIHADIIFNIEHYEFSVNPYCCNRVDLETVFLHELGHFLGLPHVDEQEDPLSIMNPQIRIQSTKRNLSFGDVNRINDLYQ